MICQFETCRRRRESLGFCHQHYKQYRTGKPLRPIRPRRPATRPDCLFEGCGRPLDSHDLCSGHAAQWRRGEDVRPLRGDAPDPTGERKGDGYIYVTAPLDSATYRPGARVLEHRLAMAEHIGRVLFPNENVHHKNGVRDDNRIENLELWAVSQPAGQRVDDLADWAEYILERYRPDALRAP